MLHRQAAKRLPAERLCWRRLFFSPRVTTSFYGSRPTLSRPHDDDWTSSSTMRLIIRDDKNAAARYISTYIQRRIREFEPSADRLFVLGLPTGSSPEPVYKLLVEAYKAGEISFKYVKTFNMDEYVGLPREHPQSYHSFMHHHFFSHIDIDPQNVNLLNGNAPDLDEECRLYEEKIEQAGGIEVFLGGIGVGTSSIG